MSDILIATWGFGNPYYYELYKRYNHATNNDMGLWITKRTGDSVKWSAYKIENEDIKMIFNDVMKCSAFRFVGRVENMITNIAHDTL